MRNVKAVLCLRRVLAVAGLLQLLKIERQRDGSESALRKVDLHHSSMCVRAVHRWTYAHEARWCIEAGEVASARGNRAIIVRQCPRGARVKVRLVSQGSP